MKVIFLRILVIALCFIPVKTDKICAVKDNNNTEHIRNELNFVKHNQTETINNVNYEICKEFCYAVWQEEVTTNGVQLNIYFQGCWKQEGHECEHNECIATPRTNKALTNTKFCCCRKDRCNVNVTNPVNDDLLLISPTSSEFLEKNHPQHFTLIIIATSACIALVTLMILILIYRLYKNNVLRKPLPYSDNYNESTALRTGTYTFDHLKLTSIIGQGRYGSVWLGSLGDEEIAVKIFPGHYHNYFQNEKDIYSLPFMEHSSLLNYYGSDERVSMDGNIEYLLVFSYAPGGTLRDFLKNHTIDWLTFCKMALSVVKGLAYLHTDIKQGDKFKPCIAHRDINSRNILIKSDGMCCICDLGLAVQISGSKYYLNGEEQHAETKSINDVGTLQYMAPEVLEGAVNLRDCESSLKQIDVYAIGLVLWELVSRCSDIYFSGNEVPSYKLPFEKEIGVQPTFEQMQVLVSRNKARPILEGNLVDKPGVRLVKETMEDCWDSDAEARLTALCIEERILELQSQRITMYFADGSPLMNSHCGLVPSTTNSLHDDGIHVVISQYNDATVDNLVMLTPTENSYQENSYKNSNETAMCSQNKVLQPYQGRNPCLERNLMIQSDSSEELGCDGNILVNKSSKHLQNDQYRVSSETQVLMPNDYLSQHITQHTPLRPATPIPFVQNVISENFCPPCNKLKQTNVLEPCLLDSPKKIKFRGWTNLKKKMLSNKKSYSYTRCQTDREDFKSNLITKQNVQPKIVETNVTLDTNGKYVIESASTSENSLEDNNKLKMSTQSGCTKNPNESTVNARPSTLLLNFNAKTTDSSLKRQESLDRFNEVFNVGSNSNILKDPHMRIKTPGDLPPSVRKISRGRNTAARFSLYDDRMMCNIMSEEGEKKSRAISNSVPFGMDDETLQAKFDSKDVTCF